jgi:hypothetical protein
VTAAPLFTDVLGSHVLPPESYERGGEGATAECGKRLASRAGTGKPPGQGIEDLIVHGSSLSRICGARRRITILREEMGLDRAESHRYGH